MLKLSALDSEDLGVVSAQMQDAVLRTGDMRFDPKRKQFALIANRFMWDEPGSKSRRKCGLHFDRVMSVKLHKLDRSDPDVILSLLSIGFVETDAPAGEIVLTFSAGATLRLIVECVEVGLQDIGASWQASRTPEHGA